MAGINMIATDDGFTCRNFGMPLRSPPDTNKGGPLATNAHVCVCSAQCPDVTQLEILLTVARDDANAVANMANKARRAARQAACDHDVSSVSSVSAVSGVSKLVRQVSSVSSVSSVSGGCLDF